MNAKEKHDTKEEYDYDIFVSYSPEDQAWVENQLIPEMEEKQPRLKVCVHERDFQVIKISLFIIWRNLGIKSSDYQVFARNVLLNNFMALVKGFWDESDILRMFPQTIQPDW